jgi:4-alpha-glucanotransferase
VASSFVDEGGVRRLVTKHSLSRILTVMGAQKETPNQVRMSLRESRFPLHATAVVATHDSPTLRGFRIASILS